MLQRSSKSKPFGVHVNELKECKGTTPDSWLAGEAVLASSQTPVAQNPNLRDCANDELSNVVQGGHFCY